MLHKICRDEMKRTSLIISNFWLKVDYNLIISDIQATFYLIANAFLIYIILLISIVVMILGVEKDGVAFKSKDWLVKDEGTILEKDGTRWQFNQAISTCTCQLVKTKFSL